MSGNPLRFEPAHFPDRPASAFFEGLAVIAESSDLSTFVSACRAAEAPVDALFRLTETKRPEDRTLFLGAFGELAKKISGMSGRRLNDALKNNIISEVLNARSGYEPSV